jgi:uroporphyrin-III C-methyltransferase/precorrin-2 dehydrogenase/sirohydrochlorin ferrochelatase
MNHLPIFLKIKNRKCLIVGGGDIALRKFSLLNRAGARITIIAPDLCHELESQAMTEQVTVIRRRFVAEDVNGYSMVISATCDRAVNRQVADAANESNIPVNVVDNPDLCSFIFPAIVDRSPVIVAVSTGGASPVLARLLKERLESLIPASYGKLAAFANDFREIVKQRVSQADQRRYFWEKTLLGPVAEMVFAGRDREARRLFHQKLAELSGGKTVPGTVYLVGAGPGDPELLTFRAMRIMQFADVVVYDRLVSPEILELVRRDARKIYAGKKRSNHSIQQEGINELLARLAAQGKQVVRLKGGDPFIFGRGGEEIETLMEQGIPFQVIPGITAASGCSSYAGIPLTHRDYAQSCAFVTGHLKDGKIHLDWERLIVPNQTLVIYMGLVGLPQLCAAMIKHGASPRLPAALVERGTTDRQRVICGDLETLPRIVKESKIKAPTLIIVGNVVKLRQKLSWFESPERATTKLQE